jgi:hypothetical protein
LNAAKTLKGKINDGVTFSLAAEIGGAEQQALLSARCRHT